MLYAGIVFRQLITMMIYICIGFILCRKKLLSESGTKAFVNLLLYIILPCAIVSSFWRESDREQTAQMLLSFAVSAGLVAISVVLSHLFFKTRPISNFSAAFCNVGFMGVPLISMTLGADSVFYIAGIVAIMNIMQWVYGQRLLSGTGTPLRVRDLLLTPCTLALLIGLAVYFSPVKPPALIKDCISAIAGCNSPIAMIILGSYLCKVPLRSIFTTGSAYLTSAVRLIVIPLVSLLFLALVPNCPAEMKMALLIAACTPVGSNVAVYAQKLDLDYSGSVVLICQSTILCVVTMPAVILLSSLFF